MKAAISCLAWTGRLVPLAFIIAFAVKGCGLLASFVFCTRFLGVSTGVGMAKWVADEQTKAGGAP